MKTKEAGKQLERLVNAVTEYVDADSDGRNVEIKTEAFTKMKAELEKTRPAIKVLKNRFP